MMGKRNGCGVGLVLALLAMLASPAGAISIALDPTAASVDPGGSFAVDIVIDGLGAGVAPSVGAYQFEISFDSSALAFQSVMPSGALGVPTVQTIFGSTPDVGSINFFEVSLLSIGALNAIQGSTVVLATLVFDGVTPGATTLDFAQNDVSDAFGNVLPIDSVTGANVQVVPEPAAALLFGLGLVVVRARSRAGRGVA